MFNQLQEEMKKIIEDVGMKFEKHEAYWKEELSEEEQASKAKSLDDSEEEAS